MSHTKILIVIKEFNDFIILDTDAKRCATLLQSVNKHRQMTKICYKIEKK